MVSPILTESKVDRLLKIELLYNYDGCHTKRIHIGYMKEYLPVVLAEWLVKYYIVEYDSVELYPMSYVGFPRALAINPVEYYGDDHIYDIDDFEAVYKSALDKVRVEGDRNENISDYNDRLKVIVNKFDFIKRALEDTSIIREYSTIDVASDISNTLQLLESLLVNKGDPQTVMIVTRTYHKLMESILKSKL